jgi:copper/silver efflux system protein
VTPQLGPDATALGQVFWYTLEGLDEHGDPTGGWDLHELRSIQDFFVRLALSSVQGVSEVASVGGYVKEYQVDMDPDALQAFGIPISMVTSALRQSNMETAANTIEYNLAEYLVRGLGYVESLDDIRETVVTVQDNVPVTIDDIARVNIGPAVRNHGGILDKGGEEVVGGVVVARFGENPLQVIQNVKQRIEEISAGLPSRELADGTVSQVTIVPFYDRTQLIYETLGTLNDAIVLQILDFHYCNHSDGGAPSHLTAYLGTSSPGRADGLYHDALFRGRCQYSCPFGDSHLDRHNGGSGHNHE